MSLMSSSVYILYVLLCPFLKKFFSTRVRLSILKISLLFSLFPFPHYKYRIQELLSLIVPFKLYEAGFPSEFMTIYILYDGRVVMSKFTMAIFVITFVFILFAALILILRLTEFKKIKGRLSLICPEVKDENTIELVQKICSDEKLKQPAAILETDKFGAMTFGILKPTVLLPSEKIGDKRLEYILRHEFAHIRHRDYVYKLLLLAAKTLHWFNPLVHLMAAEFERVSEIYADDEVCRDLDKNEIRDYGLLILEAASGSHDKIMKKTSYAPISSFETKNSKIIKERLIEMKRNKKHGLLNRLAAFGLTGLILLANSLLVFAYQDSTTIKSFKPEGYEINFDKWEEDPYSAYSEKFVFTDDIEGYVVDENNNIIPIYNDNGESPNTSCNHTYVSTTLSRHEKHSNGSCTVYLYDCQRCTRCGYTIAGALKNKIDYAVCIH